MQQHIQYVDSLCTDTIDNLTVVIEGEWIGNGSCVHVDVVHFGMSCQYCGGLSAPRVVREKAISASLSLENTWSREALAEVGCVLYMHSKRC